MIFSERRGAAVADTITIYYEGAAAAAAGYSRWVYFFLIRPTFF
jgi:hypothetical protein